MGAVVLGSRRLIPLQRNTSVNTAVRDRACRHYFYADWCTGLARSFRLNARGKPVDRSDWTEELSLGQVTSFGVDNRGELLVVNWDGELLSIVARR